MRYLCASIVLLLLTAVSAVDELTPVNTQAAGEHPLVPEEALARLSVPDGFRVTLAAAEPDVRQPIAIAFDDRGRLWVAESYSYNGSKFTDERHDRILIFEDTNGDGVLNRRKVFCDGLTHLTGLQLGFGGVWITAPPHLAFIPDGNRDDEPDGRPIVHLDGWSLKAEHNSVNGLTWGPDGWLYGRHGIKQPSLVGRPDAPAEQRIELSCSIWRYHPIRHTFEVVADGTINPWGLDFDDHGHGFLTTSVVEHLWHLVPGARYERWKNRGVHPDPFVYEAMTATSDHLHWGSGTWDKAGRMAEGNHDFGGGHSHCDAMIYLGDRWPERYRGSLFTSNIHGRRINRDRLVRSQWLAGSAGAETENGSNTPSVRKDGPFRGIHADDFLLANDPWFRAVSMEYGPDGDVYLTDWSDNGECHDRDGVHRTSGRIYKITWGEPIRVSVDLSSASNGELVDYQLHQNDWFVRHARRLLQERAAAGQDMSGVHAQLRKQFDSHSDDTRRLRALWALYSTSGTDTAWLVSLLQSDSEHIRSWAVRLLTDTSSVDQAAVNALVQAAHHESTWLVQMELAAALRRLPVDRRLDVARSLVSQSAMSPHSDPNIDRMIWYVIEPAVAASPQQGLSFAATASQRLRLWTARRLTELSPDAIALLLGAAEHSRSATVAADFLHGFNSAIVSVDRRKLPASARAAVMRLVRHRNEDVRVPALTIAAAIGDEVAVEQIRQIVHDVRQDNASRLAALTGLVNRRPDGLADDLRQLIAARELMLTALQSAKAIQDDDLLQTILTRYSSMSVTEKRAAIDVFVARSESADQLLSAVESGQIKASDISASQARQIAALKNRSLLKRLESEWGTVRRSTASRERQIKELEQSLTPGRLSRANPTRGRELFRRTCAGCHRLFGDGRTIGPELTGANRRNLHYLLSNIVDPSAAVPADFRLATVVTENGRVITGAVTQQTDSVVVVQTANGETRLRADDVESVTVSSQSMMPDGLLDKLDADQTRDLIAWLMRDDARAEISTDDGFRTVFNGRNLKGWDGKPGAWEVRDEAIWCTGESKEKNWLIWRGDEPADFVLRLEFRWDKGNSGVQVRGDDLGDWMVFGYQVEVAGQSKMGLWHHSLLPKTYPKKEARHLMATAGQSVIFAEDGSKTVTQKQDAKTVQSHFTEHEWNSLEITAKGDTLTQKINDVVFATVTDRDNEMSRTKGVIALQDHGKGCKVAFRNIRLKILQPEK